MFGNLFSPKFLINTITILVLLTQRSHQLNQLVSPASLATAKASLPSKNVQATNIKPALAPVATLGAQAGNSIAGAGSSTPAVPPAAVLAPVVAPVTISSLANSEDPIIYLDYSTINDEVLRKGTANFVYFNANFNTCRHCHKFFSLWKELAIDIRWWRQVIKLFAINCSDEDNIDMCRRAGVTQFPQVKFYWVMSNSLDRDGLRLRILGKSVHAMRHLIMDKVFDSYSEHMKSTAQQKSPAASAVSTAANPFTAMMPMITQMMSGSGSHSSSGLSSILSTLSSRTSSSSSSKGPSSSGGLDTVIGQLGGLQGVSQLIGTLTGGNLVKQRQPLTNNWPDMIAIDVSNTVQLIDMLPLDSGKNLGALLILETQEFLYTGLEVMLDLNPYANQTFIVRVKDERSQLSRNLTKRDDIQAPTLIYVLPNRESRLIMASPKYTNDEDLRRAFVRGFERKYIKYPVKRVWSPLASSRTSSSSSDSLSPEDEELLAKVNQIHMNDLTNTLRSSLMDQVYRHPDLSDDQYNALVKYVYALINYFPFPSNNDDGLKFVKRLHSWLQNQVSPMDINEYKKQFHDIDDYIPKQEWISCKSLSNTNSIPSKSKKSGFIFENPAQFGKAVSNFTRLLRSQQQQVGKLKNLFSAFTSNHANSSPVMLSNSQAKGSFTNATTSSGSTTEKPSSIKQQSSDNNDKSTDSPIERIIKSLTSGSMGSDSSILKLISTALTGGTNDGGKSNTGRSKFAREYPCGAWKVAHVMVVNEYIKDSPRKDVKHIVLHSLYQYMLHFYACSTCGNRISDVSGEFKLNLDDRLQDQGDSVILLWKVHNRISKRLENEIRPGSPPKVQFPSESLCPKCRAPRSQNDLLSTPNWFEKQVLNFLVHHYRPQSLITGNSNSSDSSSSTSLLASLRPTDQPQLTILIFFSQFIASILILASYSNSYIKITT